MPAFLPKQLELAHCCITTALVRLTALELSDLALSPVAQGTLPDCRVVVAGRTDQIDIPGAGHPHLRGQGCFGRALWSVVSHSRGNFENKLRGAQHWAINRATTLRPPRVLPRPRRVAISDNSLISSASCADPKHRKAGLTSEAGRAGWRAVFE
jgi:hypothetical protein